MQLGEPPVFFAFFVALWLSIHAILSTIAGWGSLAARFPVSYPAAAQGRRFRFVSGSLGSRWFPVAYRSCLSCRVSSAGLELSVLPMFRFMHPPMFIPWSAVEEAKREQRWLLPVTVLRLRGVPHQLRLAGTAGKAAFEAYESCRAR